MSSGASAPEVLVEGLLARLAELGYDTVETKEVTSEDVTFSLPPWLRDEVGAMPGARLTPILSLIDCSISSAMSKSRAVSPPSEWVESMSFTRFHRMSMSGWWS